MEAVKTVAAVVALAFLCGVLGAGVLGSPVLAAVGPVAFAVLSVLTGGVLFVAVAYLADCRRG